MAFPVPPEFWSENRLNEHVRKIAQSVRGLLQGKSNNTATVTLTANATSTEVVNARVTADTIPLLVPQSATAAASIATVYAVSGVGKVTITHDASAATDRSFGLVLVG